MFRARLSLCFGTTRLFPADYRPSRAGAASNVFAPPRAGAYNGTAFPSALAAAVTGGCCPIPMLRFSRKLISLVALFGACAGACAADDAAAMAVKAARQDQTVVLLHGMGRGRASLWVLETRLKTAGFRTVNFPYITHARSLDQLSDDLIKFIKENVKTPTYCIIAHSLGNIIVRNSFHRELPPGLKRIVMLAPPNRPADLARAFKDNPVYRWVTGESGQQLASDEFYKNLPVPTAEFGVIAGDRGQSITFKEPNDGVITVESTKLDGMKAWVLVHQAHTFIMNSRQAAQLAVRFIEHGDFDVEPDHTATETGGTLYYDIEDGPDPDEEEAPVAPEK